MCFRKKRIQNIITACINETDYNKELSVLLSLEYTVGKGDRLVIASSELKKIDQDCGCQEGMWTGKEDFA